MLVGFDMEWKPVRKANQKEVPSILQLAVNKHVVIIDLLAVSNNNLCIYISYYLFFSFFFLFSLSIFYYFLIYYYS